MNPLQLLTLLAILWSFTGCETSPPPLGSSKSPSQQIVHLHPRTVWAAKDLDLPTYLFDPKRGTLAPFGLRFIVSKDEPFTVFASGEHASGQPARYWMQTELAPAEYIIVTREDISAAQFQPSIEPMYVTETRQACPLMTPQPMRLAPIGTIPSNTRLYLFSEPTSVFSFLGKSPTRYGHYAEPFVSVGHVTSDADTLTAFVSALCLSTPTPWVESPGDPIILNELGEDSDFRRTLVNTLLLTEPNNVASSQREKMRLVHESCSDILRDIPEVVDGTMHNPAGDSLPTAAIFLCAENQEAASEKLSYHMAPMIIGANPTGQPPQAMALLVINLSPPNRAANTEQAVAFGANSYNDVHRTSEMAAIPAFDGTFGEIVLGVYRVDAGIRNAVWVIIESREGSDINYFRYSTGAFDNTAPDGYYFEQPWWDSATSPTGRIVHD